jgi:hypothetical protein
MRREAIGLLVWIFACVTASAQEPSLDSAVHEFRLPSTLSSCGIASVFERLSEQTAALAGLERGNDCFDAGAFPHFDPAASAYDLSGLTVRDILDRLMLVAPGYSWREINGRAVVRPIGAWNDRGDILNYEVAAFAIRDATNRTVLESLLKISTLGSANQQPFAFEFGGGTILDLLTRLVARGSGAVWYAGVRRPSPDGNAGVMLSILTPRGGGGSVTMAGPLAAMLRPK